MNETESTIQVLHTWTTSLNSRSVRAILQAALYTADTILLPASAVISNDEEPAAQDFTIRQLHRLRDLRAIRLWQVEGINGQLGNTLGMDPEYYLSSRDYCDLYEKSIEQLIQRRIVFLGPSALDFDGITEIVLGKQALMHSALAESLGAAAVMHDHDSARGYGQFLEGLLNPTGVIGAIADAVALELDLPEASSLPDDLLERCRDKLSAFRAYLATILRRHSPILIGNVALDELKETVVREVIQEYHAYAERRRSMDQQATSRAREVWRIRRISSGRREAADDGTATLQMLFELRSARTSKQSLRDWV